jgi:hypothetical protein
LLTGFGGLALLLAAVGPYGVSTKDGATAKWNGRWVIANVL